MISVLTVAVSGVQEGPYRNTWRYDDNVKPIEFNDLFEKLLDRVQAGFDLPIHVAQLQPGKYMILDGHIAFDLYKWMGRERLQVILHDGITSEQQALQTYIAMNYLRSIDWLRDSVKLRELLAGIGLSTAPKLMQDGELAADLVRRSQVRWDQYSQPFDSSGGNED